MTVSSIPGAARGSVESRGSKNMNAATVALNPNRLNSSYRIFDLFGRQIKAGNPNQVFGGVLNIDITALAAGTYLLQIEDEGERATQKFVKK